MERERGLRIESPSYSAPASSLGGSFGDGSAGAKAKESATPSAISNTGAERVRSSNGAVSNKDTSSQRKNGRGLRAETISPFVFASAEDSYANARRMEQNYGDYSSGDYLSSVQARFDSVSSAKDDLERQLAELRKEELHSYDIYTGRSRINNTGKINDLTKQLEDIQRQYDRYEKELGFANRWKQEDDDKAWVREHHDDYGSYNGVYGATVRSIEQLSAERDRLKALLPGNVTPYASAAKPNTRAVSARNDWNDRSEADVQRVSDERDATTRQLEMIERALADMQHRQQLAQYMLTEDDDATESIHRGQKAIEAADLENAATANARYDRAMGDESIANQLGGEGSVDYEGFRTAEDQALANRLDTSYKRPTEQWNYDERATFYILADQYGIKAASDYAAQVNTAHNNASASEKTKAWEEAGRGMPTDGGRNPFTTVGNFGVGALGLVGQTALAPVHAISWADKLITSLKQEGYYTGRANPWITDYANAYTAGRGRGLNEDYGTISKAIPVVGGKGLGDLYQLGISTAQSLAYGNLAGEAATLAIFFGQAADSSFDEAISMGMSAEQATVYSALSGAAEVIGEKISLDNLLNADAAATRSLIKNILIQGGIEGSEEAFTDLLNIFGDAIAAEASGGRSKLDRELDAYMQQGMGYDEAQKQLVKDFLKEAAADAIGGAISGGFSGFIQNLNVSASQYMATKQAERQFTSEYNTAAKTGDFTGVDTQKLSAMYQLANQQGDQQTKDKILAEITERVAAQVQTDKGKDFSVDRQKLANAIKAQLDRATAREEEGFRPDEYDESRTAPASESREQERAPVPDDSEAPVTGNELYGRLLDNSQQQSEAQLPAQAEEPVPQQVPRAQRQNPLVNSWSQQNNIYTVDELFDANKNGAKSVEDWKAVIRDAIANNSDFANLIQDDSATLGHDKRSAFVKAVQQMRTELSTESTGNGTIEQGEQPTNLLLEANNGGKQTVSEPAAAAGEDSGDDYRPFGNGISGANSQYGGSTGTRSGVPGGGRGSGTQQSGVRPGASSEASRSEQERRDYYASLIKTKDGSYGTKIPKGTYLDTIGGTGNATQSGGSNLYVVTDGTLGIQKPARGSVEYLASDVAELLGVRDVLSMLSNDSGACCTDQRGNDVDTFGRATRGRLYVLFHGGQLGSDFSATEGKGGHAKILVHEFVHDKLRKMFPATERTSYVKRIEAIYSIADAAFSKASIDASTIDKIQSVILGSSTTGQNGGLGYRNSYNNERYMRMAALEVAARSSGKTSFNSAMEQLSRMRCTEELLCDAAGKTSRFFEICSRAGISEDTSVKLLAALREQLAASNVVSLDTLAKIDAKVSSFERTSFSLKEAISDTLNGNITYLSDSDLLSVLNYALDRASPETKGDPLAERAANLVIAEADEIGKNAKPKNWLSDRGYLGNTVSSLDDNQSANLISAVNNILGELGVRGVSITEAPDSTVSNYANKFGVDEIENEQNHSSRSDMTIQERQAENDRTSEFQQDEDYRKGKQRTDVEALRKAGESQAKDEKLQQGANFNKNVPVDKSEKTTWTVNGKEVEVSGWVTPSEVDQKALQQAEDAVKAKGQEADLKDRLSLLEARRTYLEKVAEQARKARADFYGSGDVEQRKADLGYMADNIKSQLEQLDADMGYLSDELDDALANDPTSPQAVSLVSALEAAQSQSDALNTQLEALRDEYRHLQEGDSAALKNVRDQIDRVTNEIRDLSRRLDGVSKRAARADWGSNKRALFNSGLTSGGAESSMDTAFSSAFAEMADDYKAFKDDASDPLSGETYTAEQGQKTRSGVEHVSLADELSNIIEGKGALFQAVTDADQAPAHDDSDDPTRKLSKKEQRDQRKRVGNELATKPVSAEVANGMLHLQENVKGILESNSPIRHVMNLANSIVSYQTKGNEMGWLATDEIAGIADDIRQTFATREMDNDAKAERLADLTVSLLATVSTRVNRAETHRAMELALEENAAKYGKRNGKEAKGLKRAADWYKSWQINPATGFKMLDGFKAGDNGEGYKMARRINDSVAKEQTLFADVHGRYAKLRGLEGMNDFVDGKSMSPVALGTMPITEQQAIDFIKEVRTLQTQNIGAGKNRLDTIKGFAVKSKDGGTTHLDVGSLVATEDADGKKLTRKQISEGLVTLAQEMEKSLSPAAKQYLEITNGILFDLGKQVSSVRQRVTGLGFREFESGNYYPVKYVSKNNSSNNNDNDSRGIFNPFGSRTRTEGGYVQVASAADTVDRYIDKAIYAAAYGELADTLDFLNSSALGTQGLANAVSESFGKDFGRMFENYVADVNNRSNKSKFEWSPMKAARLALQQGALRFSISVPIKQTASYWDAAGVLSMESLLKAYRLKVTKAKGYGAENKLVQSRAAGQIDPTLSELLNSKGYIADLKKRSDVMKAIDTATSIMDYRTIDDLFHAAVIDTQLSFSDIDPNSKMFKDIVAAKFQDVVLGTQPIFSKNARAEGQRTNNELIRSMSMFRTQQTQNLNRAITAIGEYKAAKGTSLEKISRKELQRTVAGQVMASVEFGLLSVIADLARHKLKPYRKDEDDDTIDYRKILSRVGLNSIESAAGTAWFGDQVSKALIDIAMGDKSDESGEFYGLNLGLLSSAVKAMNGLSETAGTISNAIRTGDFSKVNISSLRYSVTNAAQLFGLPINNVISFANSLAMYGLDIADAASDHKSGNRGVYDDAIKMFNDILHGQYTQVTAQHQADKFFHKGDAENLLYNISILEADAAARAEASGGDDPHKGHNYLAGLILGTGEEAKAVKAAEQAEYGRTLSSNERIANYLVDSSLDADAIDEAINQYATSGGYNVLYNALRASGMKPAEAVSEMYKSDRKSGMTTSILDEDNVDLLLSGVDAPGETYDVPALERKNVDEYVDYATAVSVYTKTENYGELDKMIQNFSKLDENTQAVLSAKDSTLVHLLECSKLGVSSADFYAVKSAMKDVQVRMDKSTATGTDLKLIAIGEANLTKAQRDALVNSEWMGISKTGKSAYSVLSQYGMSAKDVGEWIHNADWSWNDSNGTISNLEAAQALRNTPGLTDNQRRTIYNALRKDLSNYFNDWGKYTYDSEIAYIDRKKLQIGRSA